MTIKASDIPKDGFSKLVLIDGVLFEVARHRSEMDARRSVYEARKVLSVGDDSGWWTRYSWKLILADMKLMAKAENEE